MFPEVNFDDVIQTHGMNISIATSTDSDTESFRLELFGVPFTKGNN
jgi:large subunit ribosomal protein L5